MKEHTVFRSLLSWLLALSIFVGLFPVGAMAEENSTPAADSLSGENSTPVTGTLAEENAALAQELRQRMETLANPYNELVDMTGLEECPVLDGDFYIVHEDSYGNTYALNPVKEVRQYRLGSTEVTIQDGRVANGDYDSILTLCPWENTSYVSHAIRGINGNYFYRVGADGTFYFACEQKAGYALIPVEGLVEIRYYASATRKIPICHGGDGLFYMNEYHEVASDIRFSLYRLSETAVLYRSLRELEDYLDGNSNGTYPDTVYKIFLTAFEQALEVYESYNTSMCADEESKAAIEDSVSALQQRKNELVFANRDTDYIDVSVEIMDFKADSLLFEYLDTSNHKHTYIYELTRDYSELAGVPLPGTRGESTIPAPDGKLKTFAVGLTLQNLQNGELIYTEETVTYVANLIMVDETWKTEAFLKTLGENDCRWFLQKIEAIQKKAAGITEETPTDPEDPEGTTEGTSEEPTEDTTDGGETEETEKTPEELRAEALGSMDETIEKTIPFALNGVTAKRNGGVLLSKDCETAFDLAYYALNNLWRPVGEEDVLDDGNDETTDFHYNTVVPERARLRMYWDPATQMYTFDATNRVIYNGAYIYNSLPLKKTLVPYNLPRFMPIDGLGFEKPEIDENGVEKKVETDRSTYFSKQGAGTDYDDLNYHFTLHASGSFVYYEDQELYFSFLGDDDVYFFIDGQMVMDLGGAHQAAGTDFSLNQESLVKKGLHLKDGEIYSFDMFYAERHSSGSNMRFSTNMHIMDTQTLTTKGQYLVESDGQSSVDPDTGMGAPLEESAVMNIGDTVTYSFELLNIRDVAVENLSFTDDSLGTDISPDGIRLTVPEKTNGALTGIEDISLYYRSYDPVTKKLDEGDFRSYTASEMFSLIESLKTGNGKDEALPAGSYWVTLDAETGVEDLKALLTAGVLPMCQLTVYGFRRTMGENDLPYVNTVVSNCSYKRTENSLVGMQQEWIAVTGSASRTLRVPDVDGLVKPTAQRVQIVLDYGKPVQIPIESLKEKIFVVDPVTVGDYLGLITNGANGNTYRELPSTPQCVEEDDDILTGHSGTFTRNGEVLEYRLSKMLSRSEKVYAVFALNNYSVTAGSQSRVHPYVTIELQLIPATSMYYETDFATDVFVTETMGAAEDWTTQGTESETGKYQNNGYEKDRYPTEAVTEDSGSEEAGNEETAGSADATESPTPAQKAPTRAATDGPGATVISQDYVMLDFNDDVAGDWLTKHCTALLDTEKGVLYGEIKNPNGDEHYDPYVKTENDLDYTIKDGDQVRIRAKINDFNGNNFRRYQVFFWYKDENGADAYGSVDAPFEWEMGKYQILTWDIPSEHVGKTITKFRFDHARDVAGPDATGSYEIDYMYIGPPENAPDDRCTSTDTLFFDFTDTVSDRHRYALPQYGGQNCDTTGWQGWQYLAGTQNESAPHDYDYEADTVNDVVGTITHRPNVATYAKNNLFIELKGLQYDPAKAEILQFRVKMENMGCESFDPFFRFWHSGGYEENYYRFNAQNVRNGEFQIITIPLSAAFRDMASISSIRMSYHEFDIAEASSVTYDYIYIGPRDQAPYQEALFFDFTDTEADRQRYENEVYCGWNYDIENWKATWRSGSGFDPVTYGDGYISANTSGYDYTYVQTGDNGEQGNIYYIPDKAEVVAVRFKISDTMSVTSNSYVTFNYLKNGATKYVTGQKVPIPTDMHPEQGYITLVGENTTEGILNAEYLNGLRVNFYNMGTGTITIDYIYMGPESGVPSDSKLFFDFKNDTAAINRYNTNTYGFHSDYDSNAKKWMKRAASITFDNSNEGSATFVQGTVNGSLVDGIYGETSDGSGAYSKPLHYRPSKGDYVQIRVKINGLAPKDNNAVLRLYYVVDDKEIGSGSTNYTVVKKLTEEHFDGELICYPHKRQ